MNSPNFHPISVKNPRDDSLKAFFLDTLGYVYLKRDKNDDAVEIFNKLIRTYPDDPTCAYHLGMALYQKGDKARAKQELQTALSSSPSKEEAANIKQLIGKI